MPAIPKLEETHLRAVCDILGDTAGGLTGTEIGQLLRSCKIPDSDISTKRHRLFDALARKQTADGCSNNVMLFIKTVMDPVRYVGRKDKFEERRSLLNEVLSFSGYLLSEDGQLKTTSKAKTLTEAEKRANRLYRELSSRKVHPDVLRFCKAELVQNDYFHAVFEASKSVADKIREKSGLTDDGAKLVDKAFSFGNSGVPLLAFNTLQTETEVSEHRGLMNLMKGLFGTFRNTTAHAPRIYWQINEQDAMDMLTLASLLHRRLDDAVSTQRNKY